MDIQTIFLVVSIVAFAVAVGFAAAAAYTFVKLDIRAVRADLSGKARTKEIVGKSAEKKRASSVLHGQDGDAKQKPASLAEDGRPNDASGGSVGGNRKKGPVEKTRKSRKGPADSAPETSADIASGQSVAPSNAKVVEKQRPSGSYAGGQQGGSPWQPGCASNVVDVKEQQRAESSQTPPQVKEIEFTVVRRLVLTAVQQSEE